MDIPVTARAAILQALLEGPAYGREIADRIRQRSGGSIEILLGSLYPGLHKMAETGLLVSLPSEDDDGPPGPQKIRHRLTSKGRKLAEHQRAAVLGLFGGVAK